MYTRTGNSNEFIQKQQVIQVAGKGHNTSKSPKADLHTAGALAPLFLRG
jgi:hypothetical protein